MERGTRHDSLTAHIRKIVVNKALISINNIYPTGKKPKGFDFCLLRLQKIILISGLRKRNKTTEPRQLPDQQLPSPWGRCGANALPSRKHPLQGKMKMIDQGAVMEKTAKETVQGNCEEADYKRDRKSVV